MLQKCDTGQNENETVVQCVQFYKCVLDSCGPDTVLNLRQGWQIWGARQPPLVPADFFQVFSPLE